MYKWCGGAFIITKCGVLRNCWWMVTHIRWQSEKEKDGGRINAGMRDMMRGAEGQKENNNSKGVVRRLTITN